MTKDELFELPFLIVANAELTSALVRLFVDLNAIN